jgi:2-polyprenyl-6-methoxyphenol hydroxylase-like FAD-dependent oxidoreductase
MATDYDVIVVGARCAGSPTAMLLARSGHRVLLVDKATFPSDTMSTHLVHPPGVAALARWGLLEQLEATACPPLTEYHYDFGPITIAGSPRPVDGIARAYCPRRTVLDTLLVDAAAVAGAEVREGFTVEDVLVDDGRVVGIRGHAKGGATVSERAAVVVGADGRHSLVAKTVRAARYHELPTLGAAYYAYWSGLEGDVAEIHIRAEHGRGFGVLPTHDGLACVVMGWPRSQFEANRKDVEGTYMRSFELVPEFAERIRSATRETRFVGTGDLPNYFVEPYGPGWALVGDAGYDKDPITAYGITDAFRDAEAVAAAIDDALAGRRPYDEAMAAYQRARDEVALPVYAFTTDFAKIEPPPPETQQFLGAVAGDQEAMDAFVSVMAGTLPAPEFFAPENAERIMARAAAVRG